jgi:hypothetical protein
VRLVLLNRARRGAYNDIKDVNISGGLVLLQLNSVKLKSDLAQMSGLASANAGLKYTNVGLGRRRDSGCFYAQNPCFLTSLDTTLEAL